MRALLTLDELLQTVSTSSLGLFVRRVGERAEADDCKTRIAYPYRLRVLHDGEWGPAAAAKVAINPSAKAAVMLLTV